MWTKDGIPMIDRRKQILFLLLAIALEGFFVLIYAKFPDPAKVLAAAALAASLFFLPDKTRFAAFFLLYLALFPDPAWGSRYPFFKDLHYQEIVALGLTGVLLLLCALERHFHPAAPSGKAGAGTGVFWIIAAFGALHGAFAGGDLPVIRSEIIFLSYYLLALVFAAFYSSEELGLLWRLFFWITVITSVEFVLLAMSVNGEGGLLLTRVVTQQPHLAQLAVPLLGAAMLDVRPFWKKALYLAAGLPIGAMVFLCQQRALC